MANFRCGCEYGRDEPGCTAQAKSYGTSVYTGIAEDIDMPIIRTGNTNIEDVG